MIGFLYGLLKQLKFSKQKLWAPRYFEEMNIAKIKCFCHQCLLQFDNEYILSLHLKVVHKHKNSKGAIKYVIKSNIPISSDKKSDSNNHIALGQKRKKDFQM